MCLGGAEVSYADYCAGDPGSNPALCVFINTVGLGLSLGLGLLNMSIYEKLCGIGVCLGGAEVWSAGYCSGDRGSNPASCMF